VSEYRVVELRVHGVSGTPPESLLEVDDVQLVNIDPADPRREPLTGFYRAEDPQRRLDHNGDHTPEAYLEGYAWGGLTSGEPSRALWLLLLPFALVNIAPRLRPPGRPGSVRTVAVLLTLFRLLALALTATFTVATAGIGVDLLAWQCGGEAGRCPILPTELALEAWTPGQRLLLGLVLPVAVLYAVYLLSRATAGRYEQTGDGTAPADDPSADDPDPGTTHRWLWRGDYMVRRQRSVHLQVGLLAVTVLLCGSLADPAYRRTAVAVALGTVALGALLLAVPAMVGRRRTPRLWWVPRLLWAPTTASIALAAWPLATDPAAVRPDRGGALGAYDAMITGLFATQLALIVLILAVVLVLRRRTPEPERSRQAMGGFGAVLVAALASLLGAVYSAGMYIFAAHALSFGALVPDLEGAPRGTALLLPPSLQVAAVAALGATLITAVAVLLALPGALTGWQRSRYTAGLLAVFPDRSAPPPLPGRDDAIKKIFWRAGLVDRAPVVLARLLGVLTVGAVAVTALLVAALFDDTARATVAAIADLTWLATLGAYVIVGLLALTTFAAYRALRSEQTRRMVAIVWDVISFWPRAVHPMAPPCYAERTVPELLVRIREHTGATRDPYPRDGYPVGALVLAGHSQGSVISAAALLQLTAADADRRALERVALLTYGCVLRRIYSRYFPAYFGTDALAALAASLSWPQRGPVRWRNLWRLSDQLGGPVEFDPVTAVDVQRPDRPSDLLLIDPPYRAEPGSRPAGHSHFTRDPAFQAQVGRLADALRTRAPL
jgi:hypothetical protein